MKLRYFLLLIIIISGCDSYIIETITLSEEEASQIIQKVESLFCENLNSRGNITHEIIISNVRTSRFRGEFAKSFYIFSHINNHEIDTNSTITYSAKKSQILVFWLDSESGNIYSYGSYKDYLCQNVPLIKDEDKKQYIKSYLQFIK